MSYSEMRYVNTNAIQNCATALVESMEEISKLWDEETTARREAVNELIRSGYNIHIDLHKYMSSISSQYDKSYKALEAIKSELKIAKEEGAFDKDNIIEIKENSEKLLRAVLSGEQYNQYIQSNIISHKEDLQTEIMNKKTISKGKWLGAALKGTVGGAAFGLILNAVTHFSTASGVFLLGAAAGGVVTGVFMQFSDHSKVKKLEKKTSGTQELIYEMKTLQRNVEEFTSATTSLIKDLIKFVESVEKGATYSQGQISGGSKVQVSKMHEETVKLQSCFKQIQVQANDNASKLRRLVLLNNPEALLIA